MISPRSLLCTCCVALLATTAGCGSSSEDSGDDGRLDVVTSFYPLQYAVQQIGGDHVHVTALTAPGAEPHDLELTPQQVLTADKADQLVYLKDFQPSVDDAAEEAGDTAFDVSSAARLDLESAEGHDEHEHGADEHAEEGHDHGTQDPHFWLDPTRYADVGDAIARRLSKVDPDHAADYRAGAKQFAKRLDTLDGELRTGTADCAQQDLVTGHAAFAYFADRYGFTQEPIAGLSPDAQPSPREMAEIVHHIKEEGVGTVYAETLVPRDLAETIARDAGAEVAVLDPVAGITDSSKGENYFEVMRSNLATVEKGQECT